MINRLRTAGFGLSLVGLTVVCPVSVGAQFSARRDSQYGCAQLERNARGVSWLRIVPADQACKGGETRMLLVASQNLLFFADAPQPSRRSTDEVTPVFTSKIIPTILSIPISAPMLIAVTLQVDTDHGMYTIPSASGAEGQRRSWSVDCVPVLDGQQAGTAQPLSTNAEAVGAESASRIFDPRTGRFGRLSPGGFPDTRWSIRRNYPAISAGRHEISVVCEAHAAYSFRGLATLIAAQQAH